MRVGRKRKTDKHLPQRVYFKHGKYYYAVPPALVSAIGKKWVNLGDNLRDALTQYTQLLEQKHSDSDLSAIWRIYKTSELLKNATATQIDKIKIWERLGPVFGQCEPDDVRPHDIAAYLDLSGTVRANREIALLSHMYTKAIRWGRASHNPCLGVERNKEQPRTVYVEDQTYLEWIKTAPPMLAIYSELQYISGLRKTDLLKIKWEDVREAGVYFISSKTKKPGFIERTDHVNDILGRLSDLKKTSRNTTRFTRFLFHNQFGKEYSTNSFDGAWRRALAKFNGARFAPNDLRSKHATDFEDQGGDATKNLQHSSRQVTTRHYLLKPTRIIPISRKVLDKY